MNRLDGPLLIAVVLGVAGLGLVGCYEVPGDLSLDEIIAIEVIDPDTGEPLDEAPVADGASTLQVRVIVGDNTDPNQSIRLETTAGVVNFVVDPREDSARATTINNTGSGIIEAPLQVGTVPGEVLLTAAVGFFEVFTTLTLESARAEVVVVSVNTSQVTADGQTRVEVLANVLRDDPAEFVSDGERVHFAVCCIDGEGQNQVCDTPLQFPSQAEVGEEGIAAVSAVVARRTGEGSLDVRIVAAVLTEEGDSDLCANPGVPVSDAHPLEIRLTDLCVENSVECGEDETCQADTGQCAAQ